MNVLVIHGRVGILNVIIPTFLERVVHVILASKMKKEKVINVHVVAGVIENIGIQLAHIVAIVELVIVMAVKTLKTINTYKQPNLTP